VACRQDRHLGLAEYVTHDYQRVVEHEKINPWA